MSKSVILIGAGFISIVALWAYQQHTLLQKATINLLGVKDFSIRKGKIHISPRISLENPTSISANVKNLSIEAYSVEENPKMIGKTAEPISSVIKAGNSTEITPKLELVLLNSLTAAVDYFLTDQVKPMDVLFKIKAVINGQQVSTEQIIALEA